MKKAKLAFWPTFSFLLRSLLFLWSRAAVDFKTWFGLLLLFFTNATKQRWSLGGLGSGGGAAALAKLTGRLLLREHKVHDFPLNFRLPYRWRFISQSDLLTLPFALLLAKKGFCTPLCTRFRSTIWHPIWIISLRSFTWNNFALSLRSF